MRRLRHRETTGLVVALSVASCSPAPVQVDFIPSAGTRSIVLATDAPSGLVVVATDVPVPEGQSGFPAIEHYDEKTEVTFIALEYDRILADLGISPGLLVPATPEQTAGALPTANAAYRLALRGGDPGEWRLQADLPTSLVEFHSADVRPPPREPCDRLGPPMVIPLASRLPIHHIVPLGGARVLLIADYPDDLNGAQLHTAEPGRVERIETTVPNFFTTPGPEFLQRGALAANGEIILAGGTTSGMIWRGTLERGFEVVPGRACASDAPIHWLSVTSSAGAERITLLDERGSLEEWTPGAWRCLGQSSAPSAPCRAMSVYPYCGAVTALPNGEALAIAPNGRSILDYRQGVLTETISPVSELLVDMTYTDAIGPVIATGLGQLLRRTGPHRWVPVPQAPMNPWPRAIVPFQDGVAFSGVNANVGLHFPSVGYCPAITSGIGIDVGTLAVTADGAYLVAAGRPPLGGINQVAMIPIMQ